MGGAKDLGSDRGKVRARDQVFVYPKALVYGANPDQVLVYGANPNHHGA